MVNEIEMQDFASSSEPPEPTVIIVGAGPVGLWTAIQLKAKNPKEHILILERQSIYKRQHTVRIKLSLIENAEVKRLLLDMVKSGEAKRIGFFSGTLEIPVKKLEECLLRCASDLRIEIKKGHEIKKEEDLKQLQENYPTCKTIIAADGSRSDTRHLLFGEDMKAIEAHGLQGMVELKYRVKGRVDTLGIIDSYPTEKIIGYVAFESTKYDKDKNETVVSVRFLADKETYKAIGDNADYKTSGDSKKSEKEDRQPRNLKLRHGTMANPVKIAESAVPGKGTLPPKLTEAITTWMNVRKLKKHEKYVPDSAQVTKTKLSIYNSNEYTQKRDDGADYYLVGDAAFGVPYFRSLNAGLESGTRLASYHAKGEDAAKKYNSFMKRHFFRQSGIANLKDGTLEAGKKFIAISNKVPWQVNFWSQEQKRQLHQDHIAFKQVMADPVLSLCRSLEVDAEFYFSQDGKLQQRARGFVKSVTAIIQARRDDVPKIMKDEIDREAKQYKDLFKNQGFAGRFKNFLLRVVSHFSKGNAKENRTRLKSDKTSFFYKPFKDEMKHLHEDAAQAVADAKAKAATAAAQAVEDDAQAVAEQTTRAAPGAKP